MPESSASQPLPVAAARAGNPAAWAVLFQRYRLPLYTFVHELTRDEQASLDVVQESFIAATRHIGSLRTEAGFGGWLFGIARQKCIQRWRKKSEVLLEELPEPAELCEDSPDELLIRREQAERFRELLGQLPGAQRAVLLLHFLEDFSIEEIARILETQPGTVKSRLHYGRKALRTLLAEAEEGGRTR